MLSTNPQRVDFISKLTKINCMDTLEIVGKRIKRKRLKRKLSQERLAELCGLSPNHIGSVERGECQATVKTLQKIVTSLGFTLEELFKGM